MNRSFASTSARLSTLACASLFLAAAIPLSAQLTLQQDPANLAGERIAAPSLADTLPINHGAPALEQLLRKLRTRASFMLIVAHPDDEDNGALTYLSRGQGARVATFTLNRGEGGQNLMSADFDDALGLIRTQELLAADRYMDVDQLFGSEIDFGFSKTKEESLARWTHDRVLYDAVRAIRLYRPLVIASVFIGAPTDGHGQHQVAGEIAQEAFKAAGDPSIFPDQIAAGLQPWQPLKVYARSPFGRIDTQGMYDYATGQYVPAHFENYVTGKVTTTVPKANVVVPEGDTDPLLSGASYAQIGRTGRALQKSQIGGGGGGGGSGPGGRADVSYHRYGSKLNQPDGDDSGVETGFYDGIDTSLPSIASLAPEAADRLRPGLARIDQQIADAQSKFDPHNLQAIAPQLRSALGGIDDLLRELQNTGVNDLPALESYNLLHELHIKRVQLNDALVLADGLTLDATLAPQQDVTGLLTTAQRIDVSTTLSTTESVDLQSIDLNFLGEPTHARPTPGSPKAASVSAPARLQPRSVRKETLRALVDRELPPTQPYFSRPDIEQPYYDITNPALRNAPETPAPLTVSAAVVDHGVPLTLIATVADPSDSDPRQPAVVVPPVSVSLPVSVAVLPVQRHKFIVSYSSTNPELHQAPQFRLDLPPLWSYIVPDDLNPVPEPPQAGRASQQTALVSPSDPEPYRPYPITVVAELDGRTYTEGYRSVGYAGLQHTNFYTPTIFHYTAIDLSVAPDLEVGYVQGTGDDVPTAIEDLGAHVHILTTAQLTPETLKRYDAVVLGVRAYEHPDLARANPVLNAYAAAGGVVIAQYNTRRLPEGTGPYALNLGSSENVVEENAPMRILTPGAPILSWPNQITRADFENWVEERGHGFMSSWSAGYQALLETHDTGQSPQAGGLLVAHTGKGAWIYLGLALYRQFPSGVPGAYRLFANLLSVGKNTQFQATPSALPSTTPSPH